VGTVSERCPFSARICADENDLPIIPYKKNQTKTTNPPEKFKTYKQNLSNLIHFSNRENFGARMIISELVFNLYFIFLLLFLRFWLFLVFKRGINKRK